MRTIKNGVRVSAASAFLDRIKQRANLTIQTGTFVEKVIFEGTTGSWCRLRNQGRRCEYRAGKEVILGRGAIQTPQILQLSGIGPQRLLQDMGIGVIQDLPGVGENMREHLMASCSSGRGGPSAIIASSRLQAHPSLAPVPCHKAGLMATSSHEVWAYVRAKPAWTGRTRRSRQRQCRSTGPAAGRSSSTASTGCNCFATNSGRKARGRSGSGRLTAAQPVIRPNYLTTEEDRRTAVATMRYARRLFAQPALQSHVAAESSQARRCRATTSCWTSAQHRKCDVSRRRAPARWARSARCRRPQLNVRGITGLRVADASIMPTMVSATPYAAVMAMAWRASDLILKQ